MTVPQPPQGAAAPVAAAQEPPSQDPALGRRLASYPAVRWSTLLVLSHLLLIVVNTAMVITIPLAVRLLVLLRRSPNLSAASAAKRVDLYQRGVMICGRNGPEAVYRFDSTGLRQHIVTPNVYGIRLNTRYAFVLTDPEGRTETLSNLYRDIAELGARLQQGITLAQADSAVAAVRAGQEAPFGPYALRPEGIATPRGLLAWEALERVTVLQGEVRIHARGKRLPFARVGAHKVVNLDCLLRSIARLRPSA
jgi:hypothetical protein